MMNLHAIAARAIGAVHPNQELVLIRCLGPVNESGLLLGQFGSCEAVTAQVQSLNGDELKLEHELYEVDIVRKFFFSVTGRPVLAGIKLLEAGSDFLYQGSFGVSLISLKTTTCQAGCRPLLLCRTIRPKAQ